MKNVFVDEKDILVGDRISRGGYANIFDAMYNGKNMILKSFFEPSIIGDVETAKLIDMTKNKSDFSKFLIIPEYFVGSEKKIKKYLTKKVNGKTFFDYLFADQKEKLVMLRKARNVITDMHRHSIIHGELHLGNMLYDGDNSYIIDFDKS